MSLHDWDDRLDRRPLATVRAELTEQRSHWSWAMAIGLLASTLTSCGLPVTSVATSPATPAGAPMVTPVQRRVQHVTTADLNAGSVVTTAPTVLPAAGVATVRPTEPTTWGAFDPGAGIKVLPPNVIAGPDEADDDADLASGSFQTKWLWGWRGPDGLTRGLATFAKEEARVVDWVSYPNGWTALRPHLTLPEAAEGLSLAVGPLVSRTPTSYWTLPGSWRRNTTRHLKFFRRQNVVTLKSCDLRYYAARHLGSSAVFGYVVQAAEGPERYLAYYDNGGRLLGAFGTPAFPAGALPLPTTNSD